MGTRNRKIIRDIMSRKARTALVSVSIFIGVLGVVTLTAGGDLLIRQLQEDLVADEMPMMGLRVEPDEGVDGPTIDYDAVVDQVAAYPGVTVVQGLAWNRVYWRKPGETGFIEGAARGYTDPFEAMTLNPVTLVDGRFPEAAQREVAIERRMADEYELAIGDPMVVRVLSQLAGNPGEAMAVPEETWTITGVVFFPYGGDSATRSLFANPADVIYLGERQHMSNILVRFEDFAKAREHQDALEDFVSDNTPLETQWSWTDDPQHSDMIQEIEDWTGTLQALALLAMLVSSFLVVTVISTIVIEQRRQIGVMKSMGANSLDNFRMYAGMATMYGVIGTIPGVLLGIPAGYMLAQVTAPLLPVLIESFNLAHFVPAILIGTTMGIVMPFLAALLPVLLGTRVTILEAVSDFGITTRYGGGIASRFIGRLPMPVTMRQAFANIYQKKGRLLMTFFTLTLAAGAFMGVAAVFMSLNNKIVEIYETYNTDLAVTPFSPSDYDYDAVGQLIADELPGLEGVYPTFSLGADIVLAESLGPEGRGEMIYGVWISGFDPADKTIQLHLKAGTGWRDDPERSGIVITSSLAKAIEKRLGDTLTLRYEGSRQTVEIIGIDEFPSNDNAYMRWQEVATLADEDEPGSYWLRFADSDVSGAEVDRQTGILRESLIQHGILAYFDNLRAEQEENGSTLTTIALVFNIASLVMAAVGAIGLLTMLFISVFERQREIGVMRSVGASSRTVALQFLTEGVVIGMLAWLVGLPLSYALGHGLTQMLPVSEFGFDYPVVAAGLGAVGMGVIATLASLWPSLSAARRTVSDILRYQ